MSNISEAAKNIMDLLKDLSQDGSLSHIDLRNIENAARHYGKQAARKQLWSERIYVGSRVQFADSAGRKVVGVVEKVNPKTVAVRDTFGGRWKVSPGLLAAEVSK